MQIMFKPRKGLINLFHFLKTIYILFIRGGGFGVGMRGGCLLTRVGLLYMQILFKARKGLLNLCHFYKTIYFLFIRGSGLCMEGGLWPYKIGTTLYADCV